MKTQTIALIGSAAVLSTSASQAATIIDANNTAFTMNVTKTITGDNALAFTNGASPTVASTRWDTPPSVVSGTTTIGTTVANTTLGTSTDYYFIMNNTALGSPAISASRYAEVSYSLAGGWVTGASGSHDIRLDDSGATAQQFVAPSGTGLIASGNGTHTFIIDLLDATNPLGWSGNWTYFRWDMFNNNDNSGGKTFTINSVKFGDSVTAVPEPSALALLGLGTLGLLVRRRPD
ncbi:PEP-CTERM sorting domain-containing protein [Akkermansiaceae bacterium]|nr:PEP-CTERM sorting domain-containing protein [Akkermansiaceae bacterium]